MLQHEWQRHEQPSTANLQAWQSKFLGLPRHFLPRQLVSSLKWKGSPQSLHKATFRITSVRISSYGIGAAAPVATGNGGTTGRAALDASDSAAEIPGTGGPGTGGVPGAAFAQNPCATSEVPGCIELVAAAE